MNKNANSADVRRLFEATPKARKSLPNAPKFICSKVWDFDEKRFHWTSIVRVYVIWISMNNLWKCRCIERWMLLLRAFHPIVTSESIETAFCPSCPFFLFMTCLLGFAIWNLLWVFFIHFYCYCMNASIVFLLCFPLTLIGMRQGGFTSLIILGLDFVSWIFIKNFQTFLEVKIEINWDNLTPCQAHWVL